MKWISKMTMKTLILELFDIVRQVSKSEWYEYLGAVLVAVFLIFPWLFGMVVLGNALIGR